MDVPAQELKMKLDAIRALSATLVKGDHIHINYYHRDDGSEMDGPKDAYFMRYNASQDSISVAEGKQAIRVLGEKTCHLEYIENIRKF